MVDSKQYQLVVWERFYLSICFSLFPIVNFEKMWKYVELSIEYKKEEEIKKRQVIPGLCSDLFPIKANIFFGYFSAQNDEKRCQQIVKKKEKCMEKTDHDLKRLHRAPEWLMMNAKKT